MTGATTSRDEMGQPEASPSRSSGETSPANGMSKKRTHDNINTNDDEGDDVARKREEKRGRAHEEKDAKEPAEEARIETSPEEEEDSQPAADARDNSNAPENEAQAEGNTGETTGPTFLHQGTGGNPLSAAAGMPLSSVAAGGGIAGMGDSSQAQVQSNLMNPHPFLFAQGPYGVAGFPGAASMLPDQNRLLQGLVANRGNGNGQQGQEGALAEALAMARGGQGFPGLPPATLQQLYQPGGPMDPAQLMMGFPPGIAGNPFLGGGPMRPGLMSGRIEDLPFASLAGNLYRSPAIPLGLPCDDEHLSEYQILVRQQLELFEAEQEDVESNTQGRKKQVTLGQVGLRCKHCAGLPLRQRGKGSVYYPTKLQGIYQAAQNMANSHLSDACQCIDERLKGTLITLRQRRDTASGGKQYWADGAKALGLYETEDGLRLSRQQQQQQQFG